MIIMLLGQSNYLKMILNKQFLWLEIVCNKMDFN